MEHYFISADMFYSLEFKSRYEHRNLTKNTSKCSICLKYRWQKQVQLVSNKMIDYVGNSNNNENQLFIWR